MIKERPTGFNTGFYMCNISPETCDIPDEQVMDLLKTMGVGEDADIRKCDIARIKVAGRRAMRKYIQKKYLNTDK